MITITRREYESNIDKYIDFETTIVVDFNKGTTLYMVNLGRKVFIK